jgi:hypothetical protein
MSIEAILMLVSSILKLAPEVIAAVEAVVHKSPAQACDILAKALCEEEDKLKKT